MRVNVFSAAGQLGRKVVRELMHQGETPIASVRRPEKVVDMAARGIEVRQADYDKPDTLTTAFQNTEVLLLIPTSAPVEPRIRQHFDALQAAKAAGVGRVVLASFMAATPESRFLIAPFMLYAESKLRLSGFDWTIVRNGMYSDPLANWAPQLARSGRLPYPVQTGRVAYVCRDDLARACAAVCIEPGHSEQLYKLTGPKAYSMEELADALSQATRSKIRFNPVSEQEFIRVCREDGEPEEMIAALTSMYRAVENGEFEEVTDDIERLTGTPPEAIDRFLARKVA